MGFFSLAEATPALIRNRTLESATLIGSTGLMVHSCTQELSKFKLAKVELVRKEFCSAMGMMSSIGCLVKEKDKV